MEIKYLGHASFQIKTKQAVLITDPFDSDMIGLKFPKVEADIVTVSHHHGDHDAVVQIGGTPQLFDWPGEYEKQGVRITGYATYHDKEKGATRGENVIYKIETEGITLVHCGDLGHPLEEKFIEDLGEVHVLMVPVGGFYTIDAQEAAQLVNKLEPVIVIPMHYQVAGLKPDLAQKLAPVSDFLTRLGATAETVQKLTLKQEEIGETRRVVVMEST